MPKYRKKPVVIEALQLTETNVKEVWAFMGKPITLQSMMDIEKFDDYLDLVKRKGLSIETLEGTMTASIGDYIIKGINNEFYPCKPDIFEKTYESAQIDKLSWRDVFDSQRYFPSNWHDCLHRARELMYSHIAFNGVVYDTKDILMNNRICVIEDLK